MGKLYILWDKTSWGVYIDRCHDLQTFPEHFYKEYAIEEKDWDFAFRKIVEHKNFLGQRRVTPKEEDYGVIFPKLEVLLRR